VGIVPLDEARRTAADAGLDLVEVAPDSRPIVVRVMDWGKHRFEANKKAREARKKEARVSVKQVKLRPNINDHDLETKLKNARRFLMDGDKVKVTVMYRGREMVHRELGRKQLDRVVDMLGPIASVENPPRMEGRFLSMILVPNREAIEAQKKADAQAAAASEGA